MSGRIEKVLKWAVVRKGGHPDFSVQYIWLRALGRYIQNPTEFLGTTKLEFTSFPPVFLKNRQTNQRKMVKYLSTLTRTGWKPWHSCAHSENHKKFLFPEPSPSSIIYLWGWRPAGGSVMFHVRDPTHPP